MLSDICNLTAFFPFRGRNVSLTTEAEIITAALIERRRSWRQWTWISQNEKHGHEYQNYIERLTRNLFQSADFIINLEGDHNL